MQTDLETDTESFLYIFSRMLKSEGYNITHREGMVTAKKEDNEFTLEISKQGIEVVDGEEKLVSHYKNLSKNELSENPKEELRNLRFRV